MARKGNILEIWLAQISSSNDVQLFNTEAEAREWVEENLNRIKETIKNNHSWFRFTTRTFELGSWEKIFELSRIKLTWERWRFDDNEWLPVFLDDGKHVGTVWSQKLEVTEDER